MPVIRIYDKIIVGDIMKCPKCKSKLKKEYKYCYSCGLNISRNKLTSEIKSSIVLASSITASLIIFTPYYNFVLIL